LAAAAPVALGVGALVLVALIAYVVIALVRTVPNATVTSAPLPARLPGHAATPAWPRQGEAAIGIDGVGLVAAHGAAKPTPIASVAKIMTAYVILHDHPLKGTASGPSLTITPPDVQTYRSDVGLGESAVPVRAGERITERQALEGLLLPSGNNMATLLAAWDAGSQAGFVAKMNSTAQALRLTSTHYADASGVNAATQSTAPDQVALATIAFRNPVFRQIVGMTQATLPVAGRQFNVDALLGHDGIVGIKTGSTNSAGGCFVFAVQERVDGRPTTVIGAVLHQLPSRSEPSIIDAAFQATTTLLRTVPANLARERVIARGETLATVHSAWAKDVPLVAARTVDLTGWRGMRIGTTLLAAGQRAGSLRARERAGQVTVTAGAERVVVPLVAARSLAGVSLGWRLSHP
jgi:serine-type D-Ala-D-Ala carboxypeptidase (penicillin-binding protein 5/6)